MKRIINIVLFFAVTISAFAKGFAWVCAIEWTEKNPEWVFVYEDVKLLQNGCYRIYVKWEFTEDPAKSKAKQTWIVSPDFDRVVITQSVGYNKEGEVVYSQNYPYCEEWSYVLPETYSEAVVKTVKEILLKK